MSGRRPKNIVASVQARLRQKARAEGRPYQDLCTYYAIERFLYRLSISSYAKKFILKGALMQLIWMPESPRPTRDIDFLGFIENDVERVKNIIREICEPTHGILTERHNDDDVHQHLHPAGVGDGITYDLESIHAETIIEGADYPGIHVTFISHLGRQRIHMYIDIGIGDIVTPPPQNVTLPRLLDYPAPVLLGYSSESTIAEKLQAMVRLDELNSRMKDFYDIWLLSTKCDFEGPMLSKAIKETFEHRKTNLASNPLALQTAFADIPHKPDDWHRFIRRTFGVDVKTEPRPSDDLKQIIAELRAFLSPVLEALVKGREFRRKWIAGRGWK